ncbi:MAG: hypothetical protein Q8Q05_01930 [bacterium]|nr:hypothetical protein [bacterium]
MNKTLLVIIGVIVLIGIGVGVFVAQKNKDTNLPTATSPTPTTATTETATATWKEVGLAVSGSYADADTVKLAENSYRMYYGIQPEVQGNNFEIYSSTSTDGKTWTQEAGTRKTMATFPDVLFFADGTYRMYFQSAGVIKSAKSDDGLKFTDEAGTRIDKANDLGITFDNVAAPTVFFQDDGSFVMVYRGTINTPYIGELVPNKNTQILLWATSADGLSWTKKGLAIDTRTSTTLYGLADGPELFTWEDGTLQLSFWTYTGVYWSKFSSGAFSVPTKVFERIKATAMNKFPAETAGDPVYAEFNDVWYMYYGQKTGIYYATYSP